MKLNRKQTPLPLLLLCPPKNRMKCYLCMHVAVVCVCVCQNIQYVYKFVCWATQAIKSEGGPPCRNWQYLLVCEYVYLSVCVCVCAGAHVTQCWAIDLLLAISRICCQDMLGICWLSCFPSPSPSPSSSCSALTIESQFRVRVTCSFVQFMAQHHLYEHFSLPVSVCLSSPPACPASASLCLSINSRFRPQCLIPVYCRCYNSACCLLLCPAANAILSRLYNIIACIRN